MFEAIVAVYSDWGIGCDGTQPITIPEDRKHFRNITGTSAVIVGRKTLEDFPGGKPLKDRVNIVVTGQCISIPGAIVVHSIQEAVKAGEKFDRCLVIGGDAIYRQMLPYMSKVYVTKLHLTTPCDSFFPNLDEDPEWQVSNPGTSALSGDIAYTFMEYSRISGGAIDEH